MTKTAEPTTDALYLARKLRRDQPANRAIEIVTLELERLAALVSKNEKIAPPKKANESISPISKPPHVNITSPKTTTVNITGDLKTDLRALGITNAQFAEMTGTQLRTVENWATKNAPPIARTMLRLLNQSADALSILKGK